ncbi:DNA-binding transcription factor cat8 [Emydomyces testavorans]|uniref:DNA-binding transcription factor cat8 n=1 Tax=Emydomyces testavorans TaxID=2070801 RepID=A0AAF0DFT4_9EURO|nr:DNA-binding transcription factor cat8 [Emydomyces testavorans]
MPGILPMKVIKVGNSSQSRVAQACDRCRSKKIRCDGIRPCCSQCANVGFECKTSDKLSRRAFPRGYTESLEERVRSLEAEVRELKCLLDEKDEKIDILSRLHSFSPVARKSAVCSTDSSVMEHASGSSTRPDPEDTIQVQYTSSLREPTQESPFMGPSSTRAFVDAFVNKLERNGRSSAHISVHAVLSPSSLSVWPRQESRSRIPPRLVSDQLLNIFFQEWAPFYPIVHRPAILRIYGRYTMNPELIENDDYAFAQLNLILGIAAVSSTARIRQDPVIFEQNWVPKLEALSDDISLPALQCFVLAQMYYSVKSDYKALLRYRSLAVTICLQLGLHQDQKRFSFDSLSNETRKRVFWCQYSLDRFAAALTGLPVLMAESDICAEYPSDADDESATETGFVPTSVKESTRISSALALFSVSRILSKVLKALYPSPVGYEISLPSMHTLAEELEDWLKQLPPHLRLEFVQDKPSAGVTSSRSPLLAIIYYFIRTLIRRPAACYGKPESASPSMLSLVESAKHIIQLLKLLEERRMSLSICISKRELIFLSGIGILWQSVDLRPDSKLAKESQKLLSAVVALLDCESAEAAAEFGAIINSVSAEKTQRRSRGENAQYRGNILSPRSKDKSRGKHLSQVLKTRASFSSESDVSPTFKNSARRLSIMASSPELSRSMRSSSSLSICSELAADHDKQASGEVSLKGLDMDYHQLDCKDNSASTSLGGGVGLSDWEHVLSDMDNGHANIYNGIYGGSECGEVPAFAALASRYQRSIHAPQQHSSPTLVISPVSPEQQGWTSGGWPLTISSGAVPGKHGQVPNTRPSVQDPFEAIVVPHDLGAMDDSAADFAITDSWIGQCVM